MGPDLPPLVDRLVRRLIAAFAPEKVILFGSWAKHSTRPGSDVDLLVVADLGAFAASGRLRARQLATGCFPPVDVVLATPDEVATAATAASPFLLSILGTGICVYEKPH